MSQSEIAGGNVTLRHELPSKGRRLPDFELTSTSGRVLHLSDYRGRSNLVLVFADDQQGSKHLLRDVAAKYAEIKNEQAEVVAIAGSTDQAAELNEQLNLPIPVLADEGGRVHHQFGATDTQGRDAAAVYVTDRFGEVFGLYRTRDRQPLPAVADILSWLEFINSQCPECEPPEWPA